MHHNRYSGSGLGMPVARTPPTNRTPNDRESVGRSGLSVVRRRQSLQASASPVRLRDAISNSSVPPMQCYQSLLKALRPFSKSKRSCSGGVKFLRARQEASALICATSTFTLAVTFATVNLQEDLRSVFTLGHAAGWSGLQTDGKGRNYFFMPNFNVILWRLLHKCVHTHSHTYGRHRCSFTLYVI